MDINKTLQELKARPGFADHVGMMLVHNGVVRGWSRQDGSPVSAVDIRPDRARMETIRQELEQRPGIFAIVAEAREGLLKPGDDVLFLVVAGDIREHVKATFAELLDRIKAEAVIKQEYLQQE
ncbi:MAG: molybdenum cofactor biosynthesis protein MoaE [Desulfovibrio sp.]|nr:molybdenum cofactor biosynthesis protein MoaE [Desulfovibrio sp.]